MIEADADAYRQEWVLKTGREPEDVYVPTALRTAWSDVEAGPEQMELPLDLPPAEAPTAAYQTAFIVVLGHDGSVSAISDVQTLQTPFMVEREALFSDIRSAARVILAEADAQYIARLVRGEKV